MNAADGGDRRCLLVTNNEVPAELVDRLRADRCRPGDPDWNRCGVFEAVTRPRVLAVTTGGSTKATWDTYAANVEFFTVIYEAPLSVATHHSFFRVAPLLWLRAGAAGRRINNLEKGWDVADTYGVIADLDHLEDFLEAINSCDRVRIAYIVTDDDRQFAATCSALPEHVEPVRLYESYLRNFQIDARRSSR